MTELPIANQFYQFRLAFGVLRLGLTRDPRLQTLDFFLRDLTPKADLLEPAEFAPKGCALC